MLKVSISDNLMKIMNCKKEIKTTLYIFHFEPTKSFKQTLKSTTPFLYNRILEIQQKGKEKNQKKIFSLSLFIQIS